MDKVKRNEVKDVGGRVVTLKTVKEIRVLSSYALTFEPPKLESKVINLKLKLSNKQHCNYRESFCLLFECELIYLCF